ncbi:MAG: hypothetical protein FWG43_00210 [Clostridiales bacterium]|nr:hypothetical protein [Clostridiales bacterium]
MAANFKKIAAILLAALVICIFSSVALADEPLYAFALNKLGLLLGTENGYDLEKPCDRLMGAVFLTRFLGWEHLALAAQYPQPFFDITDTYADKYVSYLHANGLVQGQSADSYGKGAMTGNQFATLMLRALGYRDNIDFIWDNALNKLAELGIVNPADLAALNQGSFLRADAVLICYKTLYAIPVGNDMPLVHKLLWDDVFSVSQLDATKDGVLMIAADMPGIISNEAVVYSIEDAKKLFLLAIKNAQSITVIRMPGFSAADRETVVYDVLGEFRSYGQILPIEAYTIRDVVVLNVDIYPAYMMENYYKDPQRYQKHYHFADPESPIHEESAYEIIKYQRMDTWVNKMNEILSEYIMENMSEKETVKAIHDYIVLNTTYDTSYEGDNEGLPHYPSTAIFEHKGVCDAYAAAFKIILNAAGLDCIVVPGEAFGSGHTWNQVKIDGEWYNIDVTWDDPDYKDKILYDYFCIPDKKMYRDHTVDDNFVPYVCVAPALKI